MTRRSKRKFNWAELSSEEEDNAEIKKSAKIEDKKEIEEQTIKLDQLSVDSQKSKAESKATHLNEEKKSNESQEDTGHLTRSTRGTRKRTSDQIDDDIKPTESKTTKKTPQTTISPEKDKKLILNDSRTNSQTTPIVIKKEVHIKEEVVETDHDPPKNKTPRIESDESKVSKAKESPMPANGVLNKSIKKENEQNLSANQIKNNILPEKTTQSETVNPPDFDLPLISVKSIKIKPLKQTDMIKKFQKFNKQNQSPTKTTNNIKFTEIRVELDDEQRDWLTKSIKNHEGEYDKEFDIESDIYTLANSRKRKY